ncbi:MAG: hypothetical protein IT261_04715 [Saprospiraceae bacterium]|nr:hypothetical protein [Saprospiraceae bacterium]
MESVFNTPVLLLLFNRPKHTQIVLDRLRLIRPAVLYVHCDGPRMNRLDDEKEVRAVRECLTSIDWPCEVKTLFRKENAGLREGVFGAINWFFAEEEKGIILEDDCVPDISFFQYCAVLLDYYEKEEMVMHIGGSNLGEHLTKNSEESYIFSKFTFVWGWASWRRAWKKMSLSLDGFETFVSKDFIKDLCDDGMAQAYMLEKFRATKHRENNSWAYAWSYSILAAKGLTVVPCHNLVQNTGIGTSDATHTVNHDPKARLKASALAFPLKHPTSLERIKGLDTKLFYAAQKNRIRLFLWYLLHKTGLR